MEPKDRDWSKGYAKQALSDLDVREIIAERAEKCHRLNFLQMAAEKVCKAHLVAKNGHETPRKSHAVVAKNLPIIARQFYSATKSNGIAQWELDQIKRLAGEIEKLAPACDDDGTRRDNAEYPWEDAKSQIRVPCEFKFPNLDDGERIIVRLVRLLRTAAESYAKD